MLLLLLLVKIRVRWLFVAQPAANIHWNGEEKNKLLLLLLKYYSSKNERMNEFLVSVVVLDNFIFGKKRKALLDAYTYIYSTLM